MGKFLLTALAVSLVLFSVVHLTSSSNIKPDNIAAPSAKAKGQPGKVSKDTNPLVFSKTGPSQPNIVVITTDDQTLEEMAFLPQARKFFSAGLRFNNFYVGTPLCCPSRASFLTGLYSHNHQVLDNSGDNGGWEQFKRRENKALPVWLQRAGYQTSWIGKYMNGYDMKARPPGWSHWFAKDADYQRGVYGKAMYYNYRVFVQNGKKKGQVRKYGESARDYQTNVFTKRAIWQIENRNKEKPLFLSLAYSAPHSPSLPAPGDSNLYQKEDLPSLGAYNEKDTSDKSDAVARFPIMTEEVRRAALRTRLARAAMLRSVDQGLAHIVRSLRQENMLDNTYLFFTSDNGFFFGQHRIAKGKGFPYLPASSVPLLVSGPEVRSGSEDRVVSNIDLAPTIAQLAGTRPLLRVDGRSLLPIIREEGAFWPRANVLVESLSEDKKKGRRFSSPPYQSLVGRRYFYIRFMNGDEELYDLRQDPQQMKALSDKSLLRQYRRQLRRMAACQGKRCS